MKINKIKQILFALLLVNSTTIFAQQTTQETNSINWWLKNFDSELFDDTSLKSSSIKNSESWFDSNWGISSDTYHKLELDANNEDTQLMGFDFKRRVFSLSDDTFVNLGLGWHDKDLTDNSNAGARVLIEGKVGLGGLVYLYGKTAWYPELNDKSNQLDSDRKEFEAGLSYVPTSYLSFRAGYRKFVIDYGDDLNDDSRSNGGTGFVLGAGINW